MITAPNIVTMKTLYEGYIDAGFALCIINEGKGPRGIGWNTQGQAIHDASLIPSGSGVGLLHAYSAPMTCSLDIDSLDHAALMLASHGIVLNDLLNAPDAVGIDSGNPGHAKLLYRLPAKCKAMPSKQVKLAGTVAYELRCATAGGLSVQDVLPSAINHPMTGRPYRWTGLGDWRGLPTLPDSLLSVWQSMLETDTRRTITTGASLAATWDEVQGALEWLDPDMGREDWIHCGMALHWAGTQSNRLDEALQLWDTWSSKGTKYRGQRDILHCWNSFKPDKDNSIRLGTLFKLAKDAGWVRPPVDVKALFSSTITSGEPDKEGDTEGTTDDLTVPDVIPEAPINMLADPRKGEVRVPLRLDLVPPLLARRVREISSTVGCDPAVALWAGLAAASAAMDYRSTLTVCPGFTVRPILWLMTIGKPADKKTPGSAPMLAPLEKIEHEDKPRYNRELKIWEAREAVAIAAKKRWHASKSTPEAMLDAATSPDGAFSDIPPEMSLPPRPHALQITVSDITSQRLARTCAEQPRGVLAYLDEMKSWMQKMSDPKSGESRSTWVQGFEGSSYKVDRVADGAIHVDNLAVGIYGNVQPNVLKENAKQLMSDGLLQRFLYVTLNTDLTGVGDPVPEYMTSSHQWEQCLRLLSAMPATTYTLSEGAYEVFRQFQGHMDRVRQREDLLQSSDVYQQAIGKQVGQCARMALVWHAIESPWVTQLSADLMRRVVRFMVSVVIPSMRYVLDSTLYESTFDTWLRDHILTRADLVSVTLSEIKAAGQHRLTAVTRWEADQVVMDGMRDLERVRWVARIDDGSRTSVPTWAINPQLLAQFEEQRDKVIIARQERLQEIYADNPHPESRIGKDVYGFDPNRHGKPMGSAP